MTRAAKSFSQKKIDRIRGLIRRGELCERTARLMADDRYAARRDDASLRCYATRRAHGTDLYRAYASEVMGVAVK